MVDWIIYYADGSSFTSDDGPPEDAPREGVQCLAVASPKVGKLIWHGGSSFGAEYYCWQGEWVPHDDSGMKKYLREPGPTKIVLQSYTIPAQEFMAIYEAAVADERLPWKTDKDPREPLEPTL